MVTDNLLDMIGNTPLLNLFKTTGHNIYAKAEFLNPGGSIKDRIAKHMLLDAIEKGKLKKGMKIVEPTSGNTGIGLALAGKLLGYEVIIVMPENMSEERKRIINSLGAQLILTPEQQSVDGAVLKAREISEGGDVFMPMQFENFANAEIHYLTTGREIFEQLDGHVDVFVSGLGSGGTLAGVGRYLKEKNPDVKIVAVEPKNVSALLGHEPGLHKIQGIGDGFVPKILDADIIDDIIEVTDDDAVNTARKITACQGALVGTSSGANVWAATQMAKKYGKDKVITTILADRAERYFSTALL